MFLMWIYLTSSSRSCKNFLVRLLQEKPHDVSSLVLELDLTNLPKKTSSLGNVVPPVQLLLGKSATATAVLILVILHHLAALLRGLEIVVVGATVVEEILTTTVANPATMLLLLVLPAVLATQLLGHKLLQLTLHKLLHLTLLQQPATVDMLLQAMLAGPTPSSKVWELHQALPLLLA